MVECSLREGHDGEKTGALFRFLVRVSEVINVGMAFEEPAVVLTLMVLYLIEQEGIYSMSKVSRESVLSSRVYSPSVTDSRYKSHSSMLPNSRPFFLPA